MSAVTGIDDRHLRVKGSCLGSALLGRTHDDNIRVGGHHFDGILQSFTFGSGGRAGIGKTKHIASQPQHGGLERKIGSGRGLKKEACHYVPMERIGKILGMRDDLTGQPI